MITNGYMYTKDADEPELTRSISMNGKRVFQLLDEDYYIDLMAADQYANTIAVTIKRNIEKETE